MASDSSFKCCDASCDAVKFRLSLDREHAQKKGKEHIRAQLQHRRASQRYQLLGFLNQGMKNYLPSVRSLCSTDEVAVRGNVQRGLLTWLETEG
jgi:hypothetical protein